MAFQTNLGALEQSWLPESQWCVASQVCSRNREDRTSLKDLSPWPSCYCPVPWTQLESSNLLHQEKKDGKKVKGLSDFVGTR